MQHDAPWKSKVQELFQVCQDEIKRTTSIGKKMLSASKTNACLQEAYKELGYLACQALDKKKIEWDDSQALKLMETIASCKKILEDMEGEVNNIKKSS